MARISLGIGLGLSDLQGSTGAVGTAPVISIYSPEDDATGVSASANLVATFDQNIVFDIAGGTLVLRHSGTTVVETFTIASTTSATGDGGGTATIVGNQLTVNPGANMADSLSHSFQIAATSIDSDVNGLSFAGITDDTTWNWTTAAASTAGEPIGLLLALTKAA